MTTTSRERWRRAEAIFGAALERPGVERQAFLDRACGDDRALRREVEALLAADVEAAAFLARPAMEELTPGAETEPDALPSGERGFGAYRLVRKLGEGGMSTVYLAVRADRELRRRVAIKCLRTGSATADRRRRLEREGQILASLEHPSIARLYDAGTAEDGLPYFVMEYVEGEPITAYCDRQRLSITERLELFRAVCAAVQYAHQNLIVHRDLKPSNILVTTDGVPKLLDFGIAKWLNPELTSRQLAMTVPWQRFLTPEYASPEQVQGRPVTTASDVYSLGVLLYELLAGARPFRFDGRSTLEIERLILEREPPPPSAVVAAAADDDGAIARARGLEPRKLRRRLAGDLDTIVAKAMRKEPRRRYGSAEQLAEDLRRHLVGLPVTARPATLSYRTARFVRRNRLAVTLALAFLAVLLGSAIGLGMLAARVVEERNQAENERLKAKQVTHFFKEVFELANPQEVEGELTGGELLDRAAEKLETELDGWPKLQSDLMNTLGKVYNGLGRYPESVAMHEAALARRRHAAEPDRDAISSSLGNLGMARLGMGDYDGAEAALREALTIRRELYPADDLRVAASLRALSLVLQERGPYDEAERVAREMVTIFRQQREPEHPDVANALYDLAGALYRQAKLDEALAAHREALELRRALDEVDELAVATSLNGLGMVWKDLGRLEEAEKAFGEALAILRRRLGDDHPFALFGVNNLASVLLDAGAYERAAALYEESLDAARERLGAEHARFSSFLAGLARARCELDRAAEGEPLARRAVEIRRRAFGPEHLYTATSELTLGACLHRLGRQREAATLLAASFRVIDAQDPPRTRERVRALERLVDVHRDLDEPAEAARYRALLERASASRH